MARSESPDTRLLLSLIRRRLALLSIYWAAQRLRDREQSTLCAVNSYWFAVNCWQGKQKYQCAGSVSYLLVSFVKTKSKLSSVSSLSKEPFREHRILGNELVCRSWNASHQRGYAVEWNSAKWQSRLVKPRAFHIESDGIYGNGYLYLSYTWI